MHNENLTQQICFALRYYVYVMASKQYIYCITIAIPFLILISAHAVLSMVRVYDAHVWYS